MSTSNSSSQTKSSCRGPSSSMTCRYALYPSCCSWPKPSISVASWILRLPRYLCTYAENCWRSNSGDAGLHAEILQRVLLAVRRLEAAFEQGHCFDRVSCVLERRTPRSNQQIKDHQRLMQSSHQLCGRQEVNRSPRSHFVLPGSPQREKHQISVWQHVNSPR